MLAAGVPRYASACRLLSRWGGSSGAQHRGHVRRPLLGHLPQPRAPVLAPLVAGHPRTGCSRLTPAERERMRLRPPQISSSVFSDRLISRHFPSRHTRTQFGCIWMHINFLIFCFIPMSDYDIKVQFDGKQFATLPALHGSSLGLLPKLYFWISRLCPFISMTEMRKSLSFHYGLQKLDFDLLINTMQG